MAKWRTLEEYTPFARLLVEYMWASGPRSCQRVRRTHGRAQAGALDVAQQ